MVKVRGNSTKSKLQQPKKYSAFDRLYNNGKQKLKRAEYRARLNEQRPPSGCTFYPQTNGIKKIKNRRVKVDEVLKCSISSMIQAVVDVDGSSDRALLATAYSTNMRRRQMEIQDEARIQLLQARRKEGAFVSDRLYNDGLKRRKKKMEEIRKYEKRRPINCTFKPETNASLKSRHKQRGSKNGRTTPNYIASQKKGKQEKGGDGKKKKKRYEYLYEQHEAQRKKRQSELKEAIKKRDKILTLPPISPGESKRASMASHDNQSVNQRSTGADLPTIKIGKRYNKAIHRQQVEKLKYLRQKSECTFQPNINRKKKNVSSGDEEDIVTRLMKLGKKQKENRIKMSKRSLEMSGCTFKPKINRRLMAKEDDNGTTPFQRLYKSGQAFIKKREERHKNRAKPKFEPDLSPSKGYFEKYWYSKKGDQRPRARRTLRNSRTLSAATIEPKVADNKVIVALLGKVFELLDKKREGRVTKKNMLKGLSFDNRIKAILSRDNTLKPLQKPRHVNAIFSVASIADPRFVTYSEFISIGKMLRMIYTKNSPNLNHRIISKESSSVSGVPQQPPANVNEVEQQAEKPKASSVVSPRDKNPDDVVRKDIADDEGEDGHLKPILCTALALHEFKGKPGTNELSFPEGVMIGVTEMDNEDGWWHGKLEPDEEGNSKWGSFPYSYVHCILNYNGQSYMMDTESNQIFEIPENDSDEPVMLGTYNLTMETLRKPDGTVEDWPGAALFKMDW